MIRGGARGFCVYVDFSGFNLSGIVFADGSSPDEEIVRQNLLSMMNSEFNKAGVTVAALSAENTTTLTTPILSFTQESRFEEQPDSTLITIEWGTGRLGDVHPMVHLGNFKTDTFNKKFHNNKELAFALAFLSLHELGHSYKLPHLNEYGNIMREDVTYGAEGSGADGQNTVDDIINGLLRVSNFSQDQLGVIENVATTGRTN